MQIFEKRLVKEFLLSWMNCRETEDLDKIAQGKTTVTEDGNRVELTWQINFRYGRFLFVLVKMLEPSTILEVGMANGISSAYLAKAQNTYLKEKNAHVVIDPFQSTQWSNAGIALLKRLDLYENVRFVEDYSLSAIPQLEKDGHRFDFAFIDGSHCLDHTLSDLVTADRVLNIGGLIVFDDSADFGVKYAVKYIDKYRYNLRRIRFDNNLVHALREMTNNRRRLTVYQKIAIDDRGADGI